MIKMSDPIAKITVGKVVTLNTNHFQFALDNGKIVHAGLWSFENDNSLPGIGDTVKITSVHDHDIQNRIVLCEASKLECVGQPAKENQYRCIIKTHGLGAADIILIDKLYNKIKEEVDSVCSVDAELVAVAVISKVLQNTERRDYSCWNTRLGVVNLKTVSQYRHVTKLNMAYARLKFPYWSFGVHEQLSDPEFLLGYLCVSKSNGLLILKDKKHAFACKTFNDANIRRLLNRFVVIRRCFVFTEIFTESGIPPMDIIAFHVEDAVALDWIPPMNVKEIGVFGYEVHKKESLVFDLIHKANVCIGLQNKPQCWLLVKTVDRGEIFLVLNFNLLHVVPLLHPNRKYKLMHDAPLKPYGTQEVKRFIDKPAFIIDDSRFVFVEKGLSDSPDDLLTLKEAKEHVQCSDKMFSFRGWLREKDFAKAYESFYSREIKLPYYGTPGTKTHVLHFESSGVKLTVFLNDFQTQQLPMGLIPGMVVNVRYVLPQKNKYAKTTALTAFEIAEYRPTFPFSTVNLCEESWGSVKRYCHLGLGSAFPQLALVACRLRNVKVVRVKLTVVCAVCNEGSRTCICECSKSKCKVQMFLRCRDEMGSFGLISQSVDTLKRLLRVPDFRFDTILKGLEKIGRFDFDAAENFKSKNPGLGRFRYSLDCALRYCSFQLHDIPLVARRLYNTDMEPLYFSFDLMTQ